MRCGVCAGPAAPPPLPFLTSTLAHTHTRDFFFPCSAHELKTDLTIAPDAIEALRCAAEGHLTGLFSDAAQATVHGKREETLPVDLQLAQRLRRGGE